MDLGVLRVIRAEELELMRAWRNAPAVRRNMYTRHEIGAEEHLKWWEAVSRREDSEYFMFEHHGQPLGIVGFNRIDRRNMNASWAFYAAPEAPRGTGTRMEYLALNHAFDVLALHKLDCEVLAFNKPVIELHKKFGFQVEGVLREQYRDASGFIDIYRLGILAEEWRSHCGVMHERILSFNRGDL